MMLISDGVTPGNEGRGYVLRRLLRRTVRSARLLGVMDPVMPGLTETVRELMSPSYPELTTDFERIQRIAVKEEQAFLRTIASGSKLFDQAAEETKETGSTIVPGSTAFVLHDTQGFPIDLTLEMAAEAGLTVDTDEFRRLMQEQRDRARADAKARKGKARRPVGLPVAGRRRPDRVHRLLRTGDRGHRPRADLRRRPGQSGAGR